MDLSRAVERRARRAGVIRYRDSLFIIGSALLPMLVYLRTMPPTVYGLDSAELSVGAYTLGLVHAPGYPLYLLLGKLFTFLPFGDIGYRLNLMSAVFGVVTILLVYVSARRLTGRPVIALAVSLLLAFSWYFWTDAIVAEVYTLHGALTAGLLWILLVWRERGDARWLNAFAFLLGLSFVNFPATALVAPGLILFVWMTDRNALLSRRRGMVMAGLFALGCAVYLYLPIRYLAGPAFNYMGTYDAAGQFHPAILSDPSVLWWTLTGGPFRGLMFDYSVRELIQQAGQHLYFLWGNFLAAGLPLGIIGLTYGWKRDRTVVLATALMYLAYSAFFISYRAVDKHTMFLPSYVIWVLWIAWGYQALTEWAGPSAQTVLLLLFLMFPVVVLMVNFPLTDVSWDRRAYENAAEMLAVAQQNALILGDWGYAAPMTYLQLTEGRRPDVQIINQFFISHRDSRRLIDGSIHHRPVYAVSVKRSPTLQYEYDVEPAGPGYRILSRK